jgi:hypothetical protein
MYYWNFMNCHTVVLRMFLLDWTLNKLLRFLPANIALIRTYFTVIDLSVVTVPKLTTANILCSSKNRTQRWQITRRIQMDQLKVFQLLTTLGDYFACAGSEIKCTVRHRGGAFMDTGKYVLKGLLILLSFRILFVLILIWIQPTRVNWSICCSRWGANWRRSIPRLFKDFLPLPFLSLNLSVLLEAPRMRMNSIARVCFDRHSSLYTICPWLSFRLLSDRSIRSCVSRMCYSGDYTMATLTFVDHPRSRISRYIASSVATDFLLPRFRKLPCQWEVKCWKLLWIERNLDGVSMREVTVRPSFFTVRKCGKRTKRPREDQLIECDLFLSELFHDISVVKYQLKSSWTRVWPAMDKSETYGKPDHVMEIFADVRCGR